MKWCSYCNEAVPEEQRYQNIQGEEWVLTDYCPHCDEELIEEADMCACGEWKRENESACESCKDDIKDMLEADIKWLMEHRHFDKQGAIEAIWDVLEAIDDPKEDYGAYFDAFMKPVTDALNKLTIRR